jgi:transcriptional regulator with XRE-family HTH domain
MAGRTKALTPEVSPRHWFGAELRRWRQLRGLSQRGLAALVLHSEETVAKVERAERWPSQAFAVGCDDALRAEGALVGLWPAVEQLRLASDRRYRRHRADHGRGAGSVW